MTDDIIAEAAGEARIVARSDVVVVGGGPAGFAAAIAARREGLLGHAGRALSLSRRARLGRHGAGARRHAQWRRDHRHRHLHGDDRAHGEARSLRLSAARGAPPERGSCIANGRAGACSISARRSKPPPIVMAAAFDPDGWKRVSNDMIEEAGVELRLHSWFSKPIVRDGRIKGVICDTKAGREAILGDVVIDATGDLDVAAAAGAAFTEGGYIVTTVFRLGGVDTDEAERFRLAHPEDYATIDREAKRIIGGSWEYWWLKTPLPGVVWCNCPHMTGFDALEGRGPDAADFEGRKRIAALVDYARAKVPGFKNCFVVDVAPQLGVRQTRLLEGEYVVTKEDVIERVHFHDTVARGRDYYTPYRSMLPKDVEGLIVAGRHYSATESRAEDVARDPALHVDGPVGRRRRRARAQAATCRAPRRARGHLRRRARPGRRSGRSPLRQRQDHGESRVTNADRTAARRHPRHRLHPGDDGAGRDPDARRLRRRRHQDRAAGDRRSLAHLLPERSGRARSARSIARSTATSARSCSTCASPRTRRRCCACSRPRTWSSTISGPA